MFPGPDLVMICPGCSGPFRQASLASGNTFGARLWSDGYLDAPMLPAQPPAGACPACGKAVLTDELEVIQAIQPWDHPGPGALPPLLKPATRTQFHDLARQADSHAEAFQLGLWALWLADHPWRAARPRPWQRTRPMRTLLQDLAAWADPGKPEEGLLSVEFARQAGDFPGALAWIAKLRAQDQSEGLAVLVAQLERRCREGQAALFCFEAEPG